MEGLLFQVGIIGLIILGCIYILYILFFNKKISSCSKRNNKVYILRDFYYLASEDYNVKEVIRVILKNKEVCVDNSEVEERAKVLSCIREQCDFQETYVNVDDNTIMYLIKILNILHN